MFLEKRKRRLLPSRKEQTGYPARGLEEPQCGKEADKRIGSGITFSFRIQHCRARRVCRSRKWPSFFSYDLHRGISSRVHPPQRLQDPLLKMCHPLMLVHREKQPRNSSEYLERCQCLEKSPMYKVKRRWKIQQEEKKKERRWNQTTRFPTSSSCPWTRASLI